MAEARRLFAFYAQVFSFGLTWAAQPPDAPEDRTPAEAQLRMRRLLERAGAAARAAGKPAQEVEGAAFALVAWFDELMARRPGGANADAPLQLQLFNSTNAATEFFHHLANLRADQGELREIYWYALALGFKGQYYFEKRDGPGGLAKLMALHAAQLPRVPTDLRLTRPLCAQPYAQPDPVPAPQPARRAGIRMRNALGLMGLVLLLWGVAYWLQDRDAQPPDLAMQIHQHLQRHTCAELHAERAPDGRLVVRGFVPGEDEARRVRDEVAALAPDEAADVQLQLHPWPYCEVVAILQPHLQRNRQMRHGLQLSAPTARDGKLREGDPVSLHVRAPAEAGVLWVDYYTADGSVIHLHAGAKHPVPFSPGDRLVFGEDLPASWLVSPPFGPVLVTAIALPGVQTSAAQPWPPSPPYELASAYLQRLRETLAAAGTKDGAALAEVLFLQTQERRP